LTKTGENDSFYGFISDLRGKGSLHKLRAPEGACASVGNQCMPQNILNIDVQDTQDKSTPDVPGPVNISHVLRSLGRSISLPSPLP
jgi:hypothetical protein